MRRRIPLRIVAFLAVAAMLMAGLIIVGLQRGEERERRLAATSMPRPSEASDARLRATASAAPNLPDHSLADAQLQTEVRKTILSFYRNVRNCQHVSVEEIRVATPLDQAGSWQETWSVEACGEAALLIITFSRDADGAIYYDIAEQGA